MKQLRIALIHNNYDNTKEYAEQLSAQIQDEVHLIDVYNPRPILDVLPIRAVPNVAIMLFADTLEEGQEIVAVLTQLNQFKKQDEISAIVDELVEVAGDSVNAELSEKIINTFYGG